eukprot:CAMPEP_0185725386 /NCGR_PEP_ID=MMETSP1171-20130828/1653_1 /TAXON_ID=374046 /ORGANISM="Helicotheca tamensis, Strain CCMP826" /LENGTH=307 /DNA_ID=CAMNT_0028393503 /DNA_START=129 /DNA_END=1052 /DNA_ORIENTATION=+
MLAKFATSSRGMVLRRTIGSNRNQNIRLLSSLKDSYDHILVHRHFPPSPGEGDTAPPTNKGGVGLIELNRPKALNALCDALFDDLIHASMSLDGDADIGCLVITGSGTRAFAAGADIEEMKEKNFAFAYQNNMFAQWAKITQISKPIIAAVNGYALGGGCELAMMCDIILAGSNAKFAQPEINLGVIPGAGGTQRLIQSIGKSRAMELILTGDMIDAETASSYGLVSRVYPEETLVKEALDMGFKIASKGRMASLMAKECVNVSNEMTLSEGLRFERRMFHGLFATKDQKEGMSAFLEKRKPDFTNE